MSTTYFAMATARPSTRQPRPPRALPGLRCEPPVRPCARGAGGADRLAGRAVRTAVCRSPDAGLPRALLWGSRRRVSAGRGAPGVGVERRRTGGGGAGGRGAGPGVAAAALAGDLGWGMRWLPRAPVLLAGWYLMMAYPLDPS